jgi:glycosyltransferase involved in cell wall biosynthesis
MKIALVLPVHNEEKMLEGVLESLSKLKFPIYLVNDGSSDRTLQIAKNKAIKNPKITVLNHQINLGKGAAVKTGCMAAFDKGFDAVIFMDSDGQHSPADLIEFQKKLLTGKYDVMDNENDPKEYVLTQDDIDSEYNDNEIKKSFSVNDADYEEEDI